MATSVVPEFRGRGLPARVIGGVLDELRRQGRTTTITCPFATSFVKFHPEYADVLNPAIPVSQASACPGR
jgi:predicted GNAT family acetyltransferase